MAKKKGKLRRRAKRDVRNAYDPQLDQINRGVDQAREDELSDAQRIEQVYASLQGALKPLGGQYDAIAQGIGDDYTANIAQMLGGLPQTDTSAIGGDVGAAMSGVNGAVLNAGGTMGAGGLQMLASDRSRNNAYQTSVQRQAPLEATAMANKNMEFYRDLIQDLRDRRMDVKGDMKSSFLQRLDELKNRRWEHQMAEKEFGLREQAYGDEKKYRDDDERDEDRARRAGIKVVSRADQRHDLTGDIKRLKKRKRRISGNIQDTQAEYRNPYSSQAADELNPLRKKRRRVTKKIRNKKRKRREL